MKEKKVKKDYKKIIILTAVILIFLVILGINLTASTLLYGTILTGQSDNQPLDTFHEESVPYGTIVSTGVGKSYADPTVGMHMYTYNKGETDTLIPISQWRADISQRKCSGLSNNDIEFAGYTSTGGTSCGTLTLPGWMATCADCGLELQAVLYFNSEYVKEIKYIDSKADFMCTCFKCNALWTAANIKDLGDHICKSSSYNRYYISYNSNGGVGSMGNTTHMYNNAKTYEEFSGNKQSNGFSKKLAINTFAKDGKVFIGWNTKQDGTGTSYKDGAEILNLTATNNGTVTLYAQWVDENQTLKVNPNGGSWEGSTEVKSLTIKYKNTKTIEIPTRKGYVFKGWTLTGEGSTMSSLTQNNATFTMGLETATLTANWELAKYEVKYNGNGATSGTMANSNHIYSTEKELNQNTYVREYKVKINYNGTQEKTCKATFNGWAITKDGEVKYTDKQKVLNLTSKDGEIVELFADWNLGKIVLDTPVKAGNIALGWANTENATDAEYKCGEEVVPTKDMTLYPVWKPIEVEVSILDSRTDTFIPDAKVEIVDLNGNKVTEWTTENGPKNIKELPADKYILKITSISNYFNILEQNITVEETTKKQVIKIEPEVKKCTLTINPNGGKWNNSSKEKEFVLEYNQTKTIELPERQGYVFIGWQLNGNGSTISSLTENNATFTMGIEDSALIASWGFAKYNVKYNGNGATNGAMSNSIHEYTVEKNLSKNTYERKYKLNYEYEGLEDKTVEATFDGWALKSDEKVKYANEEKVLNLTSIEGETIELYAKWTLGKVKLERPTKPGFICVGWTTKKDSKEIEYNCGEEITLSNDITIYPVWTPIEVEVSIIDSENKQIIKDAKIEIVDNKGNKIEEWTTKEEVHSIKEILVGEYVLRVVDISDLYNKVEYNITVEEIAKKQEIKLELHRKTFDLSLKTWISKISTITQGNTTLMETGNSADKKDVLKVDVKDEDINSSKIKFEYTIRVTNEGEIAGYASEIIDYIPKGLSFVKEDNPNWTIENNIAKTTYLSKEEINPGESKDIKIVLTWSNNGNNVNTQTNLIEISKIENEFDLKDIDSTPGDKVKEDDIDEASVIISIKTGLNSITTKTLLIVLTILLIVVIVVDNILKRKYKNKK